MIQVKKLLCAFTVFLCVSSVYSAYTDFLSPESEDQNTKNFFAQGLSRSVSTGGRFEALKHDSVSRIPVTRSASVFNITNNAYPMVGQELSLYDVSKDLKPEEIARTIGGVYADPNFGGVITSFQGILIKYSDVGSSYKVFPPKEMYCNVSVLSDYRSTTIVGPPHGYTILSYKCSELPDYLKVALWYAKQVSERNKRTYNVFSLHKNTESYQEGSETVFSLAKLILRLNDNHPDYIHCYNVDIVRDDTKGDTESAYTIQNDSGCRTWRYAL